MASWRLRPLVREAAVNVLHPRSRQALVLSAALFIGAIEALVALAAWHGFRDTLQDLRMQGRNIVIVGAATDVSPARISVASCEALSDVEGVVRAGTVVPEVRTDIRQLGPFVPAVRASATLFPELVNSEILVGGALGLPLGERNLEVDGDTLGARSIPVQPRGVDVNSSVIYPLKASDLEASVCIVELEMHSSVEQFPRLQAMLDVAGGPVASAGVLAESLDATTAFLNRLDRFLPILLGGLGGAIGSVVIRSRSSEIAAYRLSGTAPSALAILLATEQLILAGLSAATFGGALFVGVLAQVVPPAALAWAWVSAGTWLLFTIPATLWASLSNPFDLAKDR